MIKKILFAFLFILTCKLSNGQEPQKISSKIKGVTVFLSGAQITRTATASITPGNSTLIFEGLSPNIDAQSIQVNASGDFTILNVKNQLDYLNQQAKDQSSNDLQEHQKALRQKIELQNDLLNIAKQEEEMLVKNQVISGANVNLDVLKLKQALDFQTARLTEIKKREQFIDNGLAVLNTELRKYQKQFNELKESNKPTGNIIVNIFSKTALTTQFTLNYVVNSASWFPTYDIRGKDIFSPVTLAYKANVSQKTGENWNNVKLTLSTGDPSTNGSKPTLNPYYINFGVGYNNPANNVTSVSGRVTGQNDGQPLVGALVKIKGTTISTAADQNGNYTISLPQPNVDLVYTWVGYESLERIANAPVINAALKPTNTALHEVVVNGAPGASTQVYVRGISSLSGAVAGVSVNGKEFNDTTPLAVDQGETQVSVEFKINDPYTIPDDGKQTMVEINKTEIPATFEYYSAPKLTPDVFLTAKITDWHKYNLLSGEANVFFEGMFIGKSLIETRNATDTLNLSMGADKNIVVSRVTNRDYAEKDGFLGNKKKDTRDWLITIKNRKEQNINLRLEDQVPVSQNSAIEVETQELSGGKLEIATGKVSWLLKLSPQQEKKLRLKYQIRYPKDQPVNVH